MYIYIIFFFFLFRHETSPYFSCMPPKIDQSIFAIIVDDLVVNLQVEDLEEQMEELQQTLADKKEQENAMHQV